MIRHQFATALGLIALGVAGVIVSALDRDLVFALLWAALLVLSTVLLIVALILNPGSGDE